ncbi:hypothetical protein [Neolewinella persica]|uniref:hypothetical protein n=1 Tax=Neolewinella persica TaxID=70998 RepID=UPI0003609DCF|nr:hypothetical protein [Neolewinella persica]
MNKPRVIKNYEKLDEEVLQQIKLKYPEGFVDSLVRFTDVDGRLNSALPFETEEKYYLIRMTKSEALIIIDDDDDYDDDGNLLDEAREEYKDRLDEDEDDNIVAADIDPDELIDEETEIDQDED